MDAQIISMAAWKAAHPPALVAFQHGLACALEWQKLWLKVIYGPLRK